MIRSLCIAGLIAFATPATAEVLASFPSPDGRHVARLETAQGDWRRIDIVDARTGRVREHLDDAAYTTVAWAPDGTGLYYSRTPVPPGAPPGQPRGFHEVDFHRLGTPQAEDELVYFTDRFAMYHTAQLTADGRWVVVTSSQNHEPRHEIVLIRRDQPVPAPWKLIRTLNNAWWFAGSRGDQFYFVTDFEAPRGRLVAIDINATRFAVREVVQQGEETLTSAAIKADGIHLAYASQTRRIPLETAP